MAQHASSPALSGPTIYRSLALNALLQQLEPGRKYQILDLGQALGENLSFWSQYPVKIYLPDFYRSFISATQATAGDEVSSEFLLHQTLPFAPDCHFDIILGWDLFNYLEPAQLESFIRVLSRMCHPGTYVFLLISTLQQIPAVPYRFKILDRERLVYENLTTETRPCPRYQPRDVKLMMAGFEVLVSFLLRHGMQEYLFSYSGPVV